MEEQLNKMTGEECVAAEDNYYLLSIYMKRRGLKDSEWRSNLHIPYIRGIEKYYRDNELKKYSIKTIIWKMHMAHPNGRVCGAKRPKCEAERSHHL